MLLSFCLCGRQLSFRAEAGEMDSSARLLKANLGVWRLSNNASLRKESPFLRHIRFHPHTILSAVSQRTHELSSPEIAGKVLHIVKPQRISDLTYRQGSLNQHARYLIRAGTPDLVENRGGPCRDERGAQAPAARCPPPGQRPQQ